MLDQLHYNTHKGYVLLEALMGNSLLIWSNMSAPTFVSLFCRMKQFQDFLELL